MIFQPPDDQTILAAALQAELHDARVALRRLCADHGDNDWPDNLHLADALDKHLGKYLEKA